MKNRTHDYLAGVMVITGGCLLVVFLIIGNALLNGFVFQQLWAWFVVPIFGLSFLTLPAAIGLGMAVTFLTFQYVLEPKDSGWTDNEKLVRAVGMMVLRPMLALLFGYIVHLFM